MEIYAYNYITQCKVEKSSREDTVRLKSTQNKDNTIKENGKKETNVNDKNLDRYEEEALALSFMKPVSGGITSSYFGDSVDRTSIHKGHDWAVPSGTSVMASEKGVVKLAYYSESYGYNVLIEHNDMIQTRYAHMSELLVKPGDEVKRGQILGFSGSTGDSTGPHLHFEVIKDGVKINPLSILK